MKNYFETKLTYNQISFCLSNNPNIDEREMHPYHEILFYMGEDTELLTSGGRKNLKKNTLIIIPEATYHLVNVSSPFMRLKISFPAYSLKDTPLSRVMDEIKTISISGKNISYIFDRLVHIMTENSDDADFYAYSAFLMLLTELDILNTDDSRLDYTKSNRLITSLTEYISDNLSDDLTINMLSEKFHISPSGITHMFKNEIGISLHKYITQKRLLNARKLIIEGSRPTEIYQDAGFRDYSAFYKSYVSFFGYPPSKEKYINAH